MALPMEQTSFLGTVAQSPESMAAIIATAGVILGALVGAIFALVSVAMSNRHSRKQQAEQLEFESRERQLERLANMRREVYLPAADALASVISAFASLREDNDTLQATLPSLNTALARLQLVATAPTIKHVGNFQREFLANVLASTKLRYPMMLRKSEIELAISSRERHHQQRMKCVELMKEYNRAGLDEPQRWQSIQQESKFAAEQWEKANSRWMQLQLQQEMDRRELVLQMITMVSKVSEVQLPLAASLRRELEAGDESNLLAEDLQRSAELGISALREVVTMVDATLADLRRDIQADEQKRQEMRTD